MIDGGAQTEVLVIPGSSRDPEDALGDEAGAGAAVPDAAVGDAALVVDLPLGDQPATAATLTSAQLEALLFVAERPLSRREIASLAGVDATTVDELLGDLEVDLAGRGIRLLTAGDAVALATAPDAGSLVARYVGAEGLRLSQAALETLAIIAYRQPVTRGVIERIRGVDSDYVVRSLLHRRLVAEQGRADSPGRPILYGTSMEFLERFGLASLEDLPALEAAVAARLAAEDARGGDAHGEDAHGEDAHGEEPPLEDA